MLQDINTISPSAFDIKQAEKNAQTLLSCLKDQDQIQLLLKDHPDQSITLSSSLVHLLVEILNQTTKGNALAIYPTQTKLTTQQAADILNVSRPYLIKLLEEKQIPFYKVGTHRRILFKDLIQYKNKMLQEREGVLDELTALSQELDLGYE